MDGGEKENISASVANVKSEPEKFKALVKGLTVRLTLGPGSQII